MTLEEFHKKEKARFKKTLIASAVFLSVMLPLGFYGSPDRLELYLSVILTMMCTGTIVSWVSYDEIRKAVKQNRSEGTRA